MFHYVPKWRRIRSLFSLLSFFFNWENQGKDRKSYPGQGTSEIWTGPESWHCLFETKLHVEIQTHHCVNLKRVCLPMFQNKNDLEGKAQKSFLLFSLLFPFLAPIHIITFTKHEPFDIFSKLAHKWRGTSHQWNRYLSRYLSRTLCFTCYKFTSKDWCQMFALWLFTNLLLQFTCFTLQGWNPTYPCQLYLVECHEPGYLARGMRERYLEKDIGKLISD